MVKALLPVVAEGIAAEACTKAEMEPIEVSLVLPCLNEEQAIGECIRKALDAFDRCGLRGEVLVADNGSTDRSVEIAMSFDDRVRVVRQEIRGYGAACRKGFSRARGRYIVMGDADNTYDFGQLVRFLTPLRDGYDMVVGNRFAGRIHPKAMPWLHRYVGTPVLSAFMNLLYRTGIRDSQCGMRAFTREALAAMDLQCTGMELATEMIVKASRAGLHMCEIPIDYYPRSGQSKLRSFRDGWRHLRFMLLSTLDKVGTGEASGGAQARAAQRTEG